MNSLIDVSFKDLTNYIDFENDDVVGLPINHYWGEVSKLRVYSLRDFERMYPNSIPFGLKKGKELDDFKVSILKSWANARQALMTGAAAVEVIRPQGDYKYVRFVLNTTLIQDAQSKPELSADAGIILYFKYPGLPPRSIFPYEKMKVSMAGTAELITITIEGYNGTAYEIFETFQGGFDADEIIDGQSFHIESVVKKQSAIFNAKVLDVPAGAFNENIEFTPTLSLIHDLQESDYSSAYDKYESIEESRVTILIPSISSDVLNKKILAVAKKSQGCVAFLGYPLANEFDKTNIKTYYSSLTKNMFGAFIAGREVIDVLGDGIVADCTAGWAGRTASVASSVNINQLASAKTYGSYPGVLSESLKFDDVLDLHKEGINSVYSSINGPQIFGIKSMHERQNSYYAKLNIMRVLAAILRPLKSSALEIIHTPTSADAQMRAIYGTSLNSLLSNFIPFALKPASYADVGDELNNDLDTRGGELLIIELILYFIKLVEKVSIRIVATDDSVTAILK